MLLVVPSKLYCKRYSGWNRLRCVDYSIFNVYLDEHFWTDLDVAGDVPNTILDSKSIGNNVLTQGSFVMELRAMLLVVPSKLYCKRYSGWNELRSMLSSSLYTSQDEYWVNFDVPELVPEIFKPFRSPSMGINRFGVRSTHTRWYLRVGIAEVAAVGKIQGVSILLNLMSIARS
ncbi:hypothetical protein K435DRAFT_361409 [Dendrothele bispora CBS 962.96]|uniref:Uncharacterized protein n=1 Tax=Dendrothele bispora (strain CBS 962.96) TaxID=1314807 RepID=A0A4S8MHQ8_DENBC|nr:hypothetical protein K435DRAFT_361409 [Dendrothele bispora CBS 962.96]